SVYVLRPDPAGAAATAADVPDARSGGEVEPRIYDAEIVDDDEDTDRPVPVDPVGSELVAPISRGQRLPIIPEWARSREAVAARVTWSARNAAHTAAFHAVRTPGYVGKVAAHCPRGTGRVLGTVWRWTFDTENRPLRQSMVTAADAVHYLSVVDTHDRHVRHRLPVTLAALAALLAAGLVLAVAAPAVLAWAALVAVVLVLGAVGGQPDRPVLGRAVVTSQAPKLTSDVVVRALASLGIAQINQAVARGPGITFPAPITQDGPGWRAVVDLPHGVAATDVIERRDKLASGLRRPLGCVWPEPASEEHAGRLVLWVGMQSMAQAKPAPWPLAKSGQADLFKPVPFGTDQRGRPVGVDLVFANMVIGAMPRMGKTFSLRVLVLAAALDPSVELRLFELKGTGDLGMAEGVAHHYASGADEHTLEAAMTSLRELYKDLERRSATITRIAKHNRALCPENKVTPELARNRKLGLHPIFAAIDECQELFSHDAHKEEAKRLAEGLIKRGPAMGIILVLATQRPDAASLPPGVSANAGLRFCLRVMGQVENDMVLGTSSYKSGIRATTFGAKDKGIGYLVGAADDPQIVRSYYIDGPAAEKIAGRARALRERAGTITGHAAGDTTDTQRGGTPLIADVATVIRADETKIWSETIVDRLADLRPEVYGHWAALDGRAKGNQLAAALKPYGIETQQVHGRTDDGRPANRRGVVAEDVHDAANRARRTQGGGDTA
ncbi:MAG: FtsK/SpoIIIE domain-containing protein, partial [Haloechinothrix sp.]